MSTIPATQDTLNVDRQDAIHLAPSVFERKYAIRHADWKRLKTNISNLSQSNPNKCSVWYSILFGVSGSFGVSIIPVLYHASLPSWVAPLYGCISFFSLIMAIILLKLEKGQKTSNESSLSSIMQDIREIEKPFPTEPPGPQPPSPTINSGPPAAPAAQ